MNNACTLLAPRSLTQLVQHVFLRLNTLIYFLDKETRVVCVNPIWRGGYGQIGGGREALEVGADNREAAEGQGARSTSTTALDVEPTQ
jgi:hypothetical protein